MITTGLKKHALIKFQNKMNKVNYLALGAVAITLLAIFSPWLEVSDSGNNAGETFQPVIIHGISIGYGIFGLLVALVGGFLIYKEYKWTFAAGILNFINGYGYLHEWFGKGTHDSGNYGDVTSKSIVEPKFGIYLFIFASLTFIVLTLKYYKMKKAETVLPTDPAIKVNQQPEYILKHSTPSQVYQPSKIQVMTTSSTETPIEPESTETPKATETNAEKATEQPIVTPEVPEKTEPEVPAQPTEAPKAPKQAVVIEPAPVYQPPVTESQRQHYVEPEKKKSSTTGILLIILAVVLVGAAVLFMTKTTSQKSMDKTEQAINEEKSRLDIIINEVNEEVNDKKYDDALLKINSINWLYDPTTNKGYVDQYNSQRENLRNTIEQLKANQLQEDQKQATDKAIESAVQKPAPGDSIQN